MSKQAYAEWTDDEGDTVRSGLEPLKALVRWVAAMMKMHPERGYEVNEYDEDDDGAAGG
jgi:hypothetical protein